MARHYTVAEIDRMREAIDRSQPEGSYHAGEWERMVEERLRTYMLNGTTPEELEAWSRENS